MSGIYDGKLDGSQDTSSNFMMPRADLRPEAFDSIIAQKGYRMIWEQAIFCPCLDEMSRQPDYNCKACYGKGYRYILPVNMRGVVTSINARKDQHRTGLDEVGGAYLTSSSEYNVGFRDRFTFVDFTTKFSEVFKKGEYGKLDKLRYNCLSPIASFSNSQELKLGRDYTITEDGQSVEWLNDSVEDGEHVSILYNIRPVYIAINPIHDIRGTYTRHKAKNMEKFVALPKQFQIRREDFIDEGMRETHSGI